MPWFMGAWPCNSPGVYGEDLEHISFFIKNSRGDALRTYLDKYVYSWKTHDQYLELIGAGKIAELKDNPTKILADPFGQWILSQDEVAGLTPSTTV